MKKMIVAMLMLVGACGGVVDPMPEPAKENTHEPAPASALHVHVEDFTAHYEGRQGFSATSCDKGTNLLGASCRASGGEVTTSALYGVNGWQCQANITDSTKGMDLTVHLVCTELAQ